MSRGTEETLNTRSPEDPVWQDQENSHDKGPSRLQPATKNDVSEVRHSEFGGIDRVVVV